MNTYESGSDAFRAVLREANAPIADLTHPYGCVLHALLTEVR
jgi:hypothetical protein